MLPNVPVQAHPDGIVRAIIHFIILDEQKRWRLACLPQLDFENHQGVALRLRSEDPRAVSCLNCLHTNEHRDAMRRYKATKAGAPICE